MTYTQFLFIRTERSDIRASSHLLIHPSWCPLPHSDPDSFGGTVNICYDIETHWRWPSHIMVSVENLEKFAQRFFFFFLSFRRFWAALTGQCQQSCRQNQEQERSVWTNGKNDQALMGWWLKARRGKDSRRKGLPSDQLINKKQEEDSLPCNLAATSSYRPLNSISAYFTLVCCITALTEA